MHRSSDYIFENVSGKAEPGPRDVFSGWEGLWHSRTPNLVVMVMALIDGDAEPEIQSYFNDSYFNLIQK